MAANVEKGVAFEDTGVALMARVQIAGANAEQADVTSITWKAFDTADTSTVAASGTLTVADVVFDTLQTDGRWTRDTTGYNFRHNLAASVLVGGGKTYRIEHAWTPASGEVFHTVYEIDTEKLYSS